MSLGNLLMPSRSDLLIVNADVKIVAEIDAERELYDQVFDAGTDLLFTTSPYDNEGHGR